MTVSNDTVEKAQSTPDEQRPYAELGLKDDEYQRIHDILGRRPTDAELTMYSVMWSEHCSYKSSKVHLKQFGAKVTDEMKRKRERKEWTEDDVHRYRLAKAQVMAKKQSDSRL